MNAQRRVLTTAAMMVGLLIASLDQTIVDTAFPRMISELGGVSMFTWVITAYLLASTAIVPVVGKLADIYGRKLFWIIGITIFVAGSVLCGQARTMPELILFRGVQGIGGGMIMPIAQTIIGDIYEGEARARMQGVFAGVFAVGAAIGPLLGGWIVDHYHWRYIFLLNLPTGIVALGLAMIGLQNVIDAKGHKIDWTGSFLSIAGVTTLLLTLQLGGVQWPWGAWQSFALFAASLIFLGLFAWVELRGQDPVLDLRLFKNPTFATFCTVAFLLGAGMFGAIVFIPWFIQGVVGVSATATGTVMMPMTLMMMVGSIAGGQIARRVQYRWQVGGGLLSVVAGFLAATRFSVLTSLWQARIAIMLIGLGLGLVMPLITLGVQQAFGREQRGVVTSATAFFRSVGATVGVTLFGVIFNNQMARQYTLLMAPQLQRLPPPMAARLAGLGAHPSDLVQVLLQPTLQAMIPPGMRGPLLQTIRQMMTNALHPVFWTGIAVVGAGALIGQLLGAESLPAQLKRQSQGPKRVTPVIAEQEPDADRAPIDN
ncbi:MAG: drug resistance transporter, EmrB/QacA subfamily [Firmicutes bacterium]|nr:drug resistance transporter, EmrB/QacA subfamily [Bacillota bacterium]